MVSASQRFTRQNPCPVCKGFDQAPRGQGERCFGFLSEDGKWAHCTRSEYAGELECKPGSDTYAHRLQGQCKCGKSHGVEQVPPKARTNGHAPFGKPVKTYDYVDEAGELLFQVVRYADPKDFRQRRPNGNGGWVNDIKGIRRVLYRLPDLIKSDPMKPVFDVEGEKDVDRLIGLGLIATCNPMGAGKWSSEYNGSLQDRHVVIIPDTDPPNPAKPAEHLKGQRHGQAVANSLHGTAASVRYLELVGLPEHGDVSDWLDQGHTVDELLALARQCPVWESKQQGPQVIGWEEPQPFHGSEVPAFPTNVLPGSVGEFVQQESTAMQVPIDLPGCLAFGAVAGPTAGKCKILVAPDWLEPLNEFIAVALPSGERKSPVFRHVNKPLEDYEQEQIEKSGPEILKSQTERDILEKRWQNAKGEAAKAQGYERDAAEADARSLTEQLANFKVPSTPRLLANDATPEAVAGLLAEHNGRLMITSTEGGIFDIIGGRYSEGRANLDVYLQAYSGDPIKVDRRNRPAEFIPNPCLTVVLTVQPSVITDLAEKRPFRGRGFLARWLYSLPNSNVGYRVANPPPVDPVVRNQWYEMVRRLLDLPLPGNEGTPILNLSSEAKAVLDVFRERVETDLRPGGDLDDLADWGNKLPGHVVRLAGVLHMMEWALDFVDIVDSLYTRLPWDEPISKETMACAIKLGVYFEGMAKAAFALMGADAGMAAAKKLWAAIVRHGFETFKESELYQHVRRGFDQGLPAYRAALATLEELEYIRRIEVTRREGAGRPASPEYEVNPLGRTFNPFNPVNPPDSSDSPNLEDIEDLMYTESTSERMQF